MSRSSLVDLKVIVVRDHPNDKAVLVKIDEDAEPVWLPRSMIEVVYAPRVIPRDGDDDRSFCDRKRADVMDAKTAEALEKSIKHWEENVAAEAPSDAVVGSRACALCVVFSSYGPRGFCDGCPVRTFTGREVCDETPYGMADDAYWQWKSRGNSHREAWRVAARAELEFLKSLRDAPK